MNTVYWMLLLLQPTDEAVFLIEQIEGMSHVWAKTFEKLLQESREACGDLWAGCLEECMRAIESPDDLVTFISLLKVSANSLFHRWTRGNMQVYLHYMSECTFHLSRSYRS
jgi:hypothetical protein